MVVASVATEGCSHLAPWRSPWPPLAQGNGETLATTALLERASKGGLGRTTAKKQKPLAAKKGGLEAARGRKVEIAYGKGGTEGVNPAARVNSGASVSCPTKWTDLWTATV